MADVQWLVVVFVIVYFLMWLALVAFVARQTAQRFGARSMPNLAWVIGTILAPWLVAPAWMIWDGVSARRAPEYRE